MNTSHNMTRRTLVALAAASLGACGLCGAAWAAGQTAQAPSADAAGKAADQAEQHVALPVEDGWVLDMKGDRAVEAGTVKSIVTVNSVATEMVLILGGEPAAATLGQGFQYGEGSLNRAMYPGLDGVVEFKRDDCTIENVAATGADLVLIDVPDTVATLRGAGINAAYVSVVSPETIMQAVAIIGAALGGEAVEKAQAYCDAYTATLEEVSSLGAALADDEKPRVLYLRSIDSTCGSNSMPDNWICAAGGVNVAAELGIEGSRGEISAEAVMAADPDIIVCESPAATADVFASKAFSELKAVKDEAVYTAPLGPVVWSMGSTEALLQLYWAANTINPNVYGYDVEGITRDYFATYYGYELTDEELAGIFAR